VDAWTMWLVGLAVVADEPPDGLGVGQHTQALSDFLATAEDGRDDLVTRRLDALRTAARGKENLMPYILDCARAYCTLYEIRRAMEDVFGAYREPVFF
jgi:methylmalonyl-CoA mutase N-terminal domain/subunit